MTKFVHQQHSGRRKKAKVKGPRKPIGIKTPEQLLAHRELAYLRNPSLGRAIKLKQAQRAVLSMREKADQP